MSRQFFSNCCSVRLWGQLPDSECKLPNLCGFELPFFDFGPFDFNLGPEFDLSHFDRSFFELPEAGLTMISTISRLEGDL